MPTITATTTERCPCCTIPNTLQCRTRSGTATLCGFSEYTGASTPPKKYLTKTFSGTADFATHVGGTNCTVVSCSFSDTWTGAVSYDSSTCSTSGTGTQTRAGTCGNDGVTNDTSIEIYTSGIFTYSKTATTNTAVPSTCVSNTKALSSSVTETLGTEDTEANAITRFQAANAFGSWINSGATGCTGTPPSCCIAKYESRTSGFSFAYADAEARVVATGLTPSTGYTAKIELYRRAYGTGSYAHYQTVTVTGTSDGSGNLTTSAATVTNTKGYETYAASSSLFVT